MKILFILPEYLPDSGGGIISYYGGTLPHLVEAGHEIHVLVVQGNRLDLPDCEIGGVRVRYLKSEFLQKALPGYRRYHLSFPTLWAFLPFAWAACEQMRRGEGFDLVETTDFSLLFAPWLVTADVPAVNISLHGSCGQLDWHECPKTWSLNADVVRLVERAAFSSACGIQANSNGNAQFWRKISHRDVRVLLPAFSCSDQPAVTLRESKTGIVAGRLQIWKGPQVLCRALEELPEVRVFWYGNDTICQEGGLPMSKVLEKQYPKIFGSRLIHQKGVPHDQMLQKIAEASFLCVPSTWDVFNLTVVEAMSLGTPVVCSREAGASMLIEHGQNGFLFDPAHPAELAECIRRMMSLTETERTNIVAKARATVEQMLAPSRLCAERLDYYQSLATGSRRNLDDPWLQAVLAPRLENGRLETLRAFTTKELVAATRRNIVAGIKRRLSSGRGDRTEG